MHLSRVYHRAKYHLKTVDVYPKSGIAHMAIETAVGGAASYGMGQAYHRYGWGSKAPKIAAVAGKIGAVLSAGHAPHWMTSSLNAIGQAGVNAYALELGLQHGRQATGTKVVKVPASAALPPGSEPATGIAGRGLSLDQIDQLVNRA